MMTAEFRAAAHENTPEAAVSKALAPRVLLVRVLIAVALGLAAVAAFLR